MIGRLPLQNFYQGRILNVAHRGAREQAPENTTPAFERAAALGANGIEFDVHLSADGVPVVIHDAHVDRTTDGSGAVAELPASALRELDAGSWFDNAFAGAQVPLLAEVLAAFSGRLVFNVELKGLREFASPDAAPLAAAVAEAIHTAGCEDSVLLSSFDPFVLRAVRRIAPGLPLAFLQSPRQPRLAGAIGAWLAGPHQARHPHLSAVDARYVRWAHRHGYRVDVWTVNEVADARRLRNLNVDMLITDRPDIIQDVLQGER